MREGMTDNLRMAKSNIDFLKKGGRVNLDPEPPKPAAAPKPEAVAEQAEEEEINKNFPGLPPQGAPPTAAKKE